MKQIKIFFSSLFLTIFNSCSHGQVQKNSNMLAASVFSQQISDYPAAQVIDVRTEEEFTKGHLKNALNFDWYQKNFLDKALTLDKSKPVYVYCLSGLRSGEAASKLIEAGFTQVYDLNGGIIKWRAAGLPETGKQPKGLNLAQYNALLNSDKLILIDFYGDWCGPCRLMKPYLDEISVDQKEKVTVIRINVDDNQALCKELMVDALPVLKLFKNKEAIWTNVGYIPKDDVVKQLN